MFRLMTRESPSVRPLRLISRRPEEVQYTLVSLISDHRRSRQFLIQTVFPPSLPSRFRRSTGQERASTSPNHELARPETKAFPSCFFSLSRSPRLSDQRDKRHSHFSLVRISPSRRYHVGEFCAVNHRREQVGEKQRWKSSLSRYPSPVAVSMNIPMVIGVGCGRVVCRPRKKCNYRERKKERFLGIAGETLESFVRSFDLSPALASIIMNGNPRG